MTGLTLAFDTSGSWCACAVLRDGVVLDKRADHMTKGQVERLMPLLEDVLDANSLAWSDFDRIGVGVGPGNFTGIRISVSAARGLALGLDIPAIGVSGFDAIRGGENGIAAIPGPRDKAYLATEDAPPVIVAQSDLPAGTMLPPEPEDLVARIAKIAAQRTNDPPVAPVPLYVRTADAAPARNTTPVILDDA